MTTNELDQDKRKLLVLANCYIISLNYLYKKPTDAEQIPIH